MTDASIAFVDHPWLLGRGAVSRRARRHCRRTGRGTRRGLLRPGGEPRRPADQLRRRAAVAPRGGDLARRPSGRIHPVCRMRLDPANASAWLRHDDHDYWFCSRECIVAFAADPDVYVQAT